MNKTETFKFMIQVDVNYVSDPPCMDYTAPTLDQVDAAIIKRLKELEVENFLVSVRILARAQVRKDKESG